jgi:hypothetical protein
MVTGYYKKDVWQQKEFKWNDRATK